MSSRYVVQCRIRIHGDEWETVRLVGDPSEGLELHAARERCGDSEDMRVAKVNTWTLETEQPGDRLLFSGLPGGRFMVGGHR